MTDAPKTAGLGEVAPRALPVAAIDPDDVILLVPGTSPEDAERAAQLATLALQAVLWPNEIPDPMPPPMYAVGLALAGRIVQAEGAAGQIVSESIGSYTYRLATPEQGAAVFGFTEAELDVLRPWLGRSGAYQLDVGAAPTGWPLGWWQGDYDNWVAWLDAQSIPTPSDPAALSGWAKP